MQNYVKLFLIGVFLFHANLFAAHESLKVRVAYFHPNSKTVQEIYSNGLINYEIEAATTFCNNWQAWIGVSGLSKKGHSLGFDDSTRLRLFPISLGVKYLIPLTCAMNFYLGAGGML